MLTTLLLLKVAASIQTFSAQAQSPTSKQSYQAKHHEQNSKNGQNLMASPVTCKQQYGTQKHMEVFGGTKNGL
jgi:hypothetical protein